MPILLTVKLFSTLREVVGADHLTIELDRERTVAEVLVAVCAGRPELEPLVPSALVALNEEWTSRDAVVHRGDVLALMPPVSGG
jgi:molybdopterin converting factor subunit 1